MDEEDKRTSAPLSDDVKKTAVENTAEQLSNTIKRGSIPQKGSVDQRGSMEYN